jgi:hypothetical protein
VCSAEDKQGLYGLCSDSMPVHHESANCDGTADMSGNQVIGLDGIGKAWRRSLAFYTFNRIGLCEEAHT